MYSLSQVRLWTSSPFTFREATTSLAVSTMLLMVFGPSIPYNMPVAPRTKKNTSAGCIGDISTSHDLNCET